MNTSGWPGTERSGFTATLPARSSSARRALGQATTPGRRPPTARSPPRSARRRSCTAPRSMAVTARPSTTSTPSRASWLPRRLAQRLGERREDRRAGLDQQDARAAGSMLSNSDFSACRAISASAPASSTPVGPPPTMTNVSSRRWRVAIGLALGPLEREQHAPADLERIVERLEPGRVRLPTRRGRSTSASRPSRRSGSRSRAIAAVEVHLLARPGRCARPSPAARARSAARAGSSGSATAMSPGDSAGGGHLIQQRLEDVVVVAIDQRDADRRAAPAREPRRARRTRRR